MCSTCDRQFEQFTTDFDEHLASYARDYSRGDISPTVAQRVRDIADLFDELSRNELGRRCITWYLAVAIERLTALEQCGIPTQLGMQQ
jgi:hypothetical protein